jgi:hypothetical protein
MAPRPLHCWKCGFQFPETEIVCPRCGSANAPGQAYATPPTVSSREAHDLELEWTRTHQRGWHVPGAVSLAVVLGVFVLVGAVIGLLFGH